VITSIPFTLGDEWKEEAVFLEAIQKLRHRANYESVGVASEAEVEELREVVKNLGAADSPRHSPIPARV
jgi:ABC-type Fe3+-citrate transport system substrate-binding protein